MNQREIAEAFLSLTPEGREHFISRMADSGASPRYIAALLAHHRKLLEPDND
jgi:hypothetical protein